MTNLKRIIDEKGVQQRWLAEQVGVTEVSMSRYVSGDRIPKAPMAIRIADVLGVDVKDLYGWDDAHVIGENEAQPETHEERTETHGVCLDVIDRQATLDWLKNEWNGMITSLFDGIKALPPAQPERKKGKWLADNRPGGGFWVCSCCKFPSEAFAANVLYNFCPNCGAKMKEKQYE